MATSSEGAVAPAPDAGSAPQRAGLVLLALILVAAVANLNLAVANVALPDIGKAFDASQTSLNLIAVGYSLGLAASVLYLGALGDRHGRKMMLILGITLSIPACLLAAYAPNEQVLIVARVLGGVSAGMAYPTTLALIAALWSGPGRTKSIALWSALGGAISSLGPLLSGFLLEHFWWGSVFIVTLPLAAVALVMAFLFVPSHVNEATEPVDNLGGILSVLLVAALVLGINFSSVPNSGTLVISLDRDRARCRRRVLHPSASRREPVVRPRHRFPADLLGGRRRRHHRVRHLDGRDVHRSAVSAERARLLDLEAGASILPAVVLHGVDRASVGDARRDSRGAIHLAGRLRLLLPRIPRDAAAVGRVRAVLAGRSRLRLHRRRSRFRRHAGLALAHRLGAGRSCRYGVGNGRSAA